jgi:hypothetical protein
VGRAGRPSAQGSNQLLVEACGGVSRGTFAATVLTSPSTSAIAKTSLKAVVVMAPTPKSKRGEKHGAKGAYIRFSQLDVRQHTSARRAKENPATASRLKLQCPGWCAEPGAVGAARIANAVFIPEEKTRGFKG